MADQATDGGGSVRTATRPPDPDLLLAEELALLVHAAEDVPWMGAAFGTCLIGALVVELAQRGRLVVESHAGLAEPAVRLIDSSPTGDDLLDEALCALSSSRPPASRGPWWVLGSLDRRRIRRRGRVQPDDLASWWKGYWSMSDVPWGATTLLSQVLTVHERLPTIMKRVNARLGDRGLLDSDAWGGRCAERGDRWCHGFVGERVRDSILERWRSTGSSEHRGSTSGAGYVLALSVHELVWLKDDVADPREAMSDRHDELGAVVSRIVRGWHEQFPL